MKYELSLSFFNYFQLATDGARSNRSSECKDAHSNSSGKTRSKIFEAPKVLAEVSLVPAGGGCGIFGIGASKL